MFRVAGVSIHSAKTCCSLASPAANESSMPARTASMIFRGAINSGRTPAMDASASANAAALAAASASFACCCRGERGRPARRCGRDARARITAAIQQLSRGLLQVVPFAHGIDQAQFKGLRRIDWGRGQQHLERRRQTDQPRQTLRSARAGVDAQIDLGHGEHGLPRADPHVARGRQLERAPHHAARDRRNDRLGRVFDLLERLLEDAGNPHRVVGRADVAEQPDVGPCAEVGGIAQDHNPADRRLLVRAPHAARNSSNTANEIVFSGGASSRRRQRPWARVY